MGLWDALNGTIYHWNKIKTEAIPRLRTRINAFRLRSLDLPQEVLKNYDTYNDIEQSVKRMCEIHLNLIILNMNDFLFREIPVYQRPTFQDYKSRVRTLSGKSISNLSYIFSMYNAILINKTGAFTLPNYEYSFGIFFMAGNLFIYDKKPEQENEWLSLDPNVKLCEEFASILGLNTLNSVECVKVIGIIQNMNLAIQNLLSRPGWEESLDKSIANY